MRYSGRSDLLSPRKRQSLYAKQQEQQQVDDELGVALVAWCAAVAGRYGVAVTNLTTSLADGRALCLLIHYYHPKILPIRQIKKTTRNAAEESASHGEATADAAVAEVAPKVVSGVAGGSGSGSGSSQQRGIEGEHRNFATLKRACKDIGGIPISLPAYDSVNPPEHATMAVFLGFLFAQLIDSSEQVRYPLLPLANLSN